jgi:hypothetical protein
LRARAVLPSKHSHERGRKRIVARLLRDKDLGVAGDELLSVQINRHPRLGGRAGV